MLITWSVAFKISWIVSSSKLPPPPSFFLETSIVSRDEKQATAIKSQLQRIVRAMYSSSPVHGPLLVSTILNDADLKALWEEEVKVINVPLCISNSFFYCSISLCTYRLCLSHKVMVERLIRMRITLRRTLEELNSSASWEHITKQVTILKSLNNRFLDVAADCWKTSGWDVLLLWFIP